MYVQITEIFLTNFLNERTSSSEQIIKFLILFFFSLKKKNKGTHEI